MRITKKLIDRLGQLEEQKKALEKEITEIKTVLRADGRETFVGAKYNTQIIETESTRLDTKLAKGLLTPAQIIHCSVSSIRVEVRTKPNTPEV